MIAHKLTHAVITVFGYTELLKRSHTNFNSSRSVWIELLECVFSKVSLCSNSLRFFPVYCLVVLITMFGISCSIENLLSQLAEDHLLLRVILSLQLLLSKVFELAKNMASCWHIARLCSSLTFAISNLIEITVYLHIFYFNSAYLSPYVPKINTFSRVFYVCRLFRVHCSHSNQSLVLKTYTLWLPAINT